MTAPAPDPSMLPAAALMLAAIDRDTDKTVQIIRDDPAELIEHLMSLAMMFGLAAYGNEHRVRAQLAAYAQFCELENGEDTP